ncbi:DUF3427 domain-containing protein [Kitasatospora sp. NBC_00315]|uniref:DUF3427 domain-containing protein n=1 Tax=Kitasatospora sp. NBC_00315 TaxID=2975963 RepID=UPI003255EAED
MPDPNAPHPQLVPGLYESVVTDSLSGRLAGLAGSGLRAVDREVAKESSSYVLARHIGLQAQRVLQEMDPDQRVEAANRLLSVLAGHGGGADPVDQVAAGPRELIAIAEQEAPGVYAIRPVTPLSESALLTNAPEEQSLGHELRAEIVTADRVDLLCAFVKWHGLRIIEEQLRELHRRGVPLRVITTTYIGATERRALDRLVREFGAEVKINYELRTTRLHAKAWLFRRATGFDTAYVGSSNLSKAALLDGLEWNVRLSAVATPAVLRKFEATFDSYWNNPDFKSYDPDRDAEELDRALLEAGGGRQDDGRRISLSGLEVRPHPHQKGMLELLRTEREVHQRHRNLLVAATGTGKTVMAALDYKQLRKESGRDLTLLFVAHRQEILKQSLRTYREVLADANFGELMVAGERPELRRHVFASIQSLHTRGLGSFAPDHFDVIVIDEFHHAEAATYRKVIDRFTPRELLGLTATPERADGKRVQDEFFDGRIAAEMRLWQAMEDDLLCPFHYFGVHDNTDLSGVSWRQGAYDPVELTNVLTAGDAQALQVVGTVRGKISDPLRMRALGFCVSVRHAEHMARAFNRAGFCARALSGHTPAAERKAALDGLSSGEIQVLFTVDLFNEGLDIPGIDTLLLLRPTSSATIFLQQLGRGLRRSADKAVLTVLDFIGYQRKEFRFEEQFRALTGYTRKALENNVSRDFPHLPSGCQIILDRVSKDIVLRNIRQQLAANVKVLTQEVRAHGDSRLGSYLTENQRHITDVYRGGNSWTGILRRAGLTPPAEVPGEAALLKRMAALLHVDDPDRAQAYSRLVEDDSEPYQKLDDRMRAYAEMLFFSLWPGGGGFTSVGEGLESLRPHKAVRSELRQLFAHGLEHARHAPRPLGLDLGPLTGRPLAVHAHYNTPELLAALRWAELGRRLPTPFNAGVAWCQETLTDALLVTVRKDEKDFSENTRYHDYALSEDLFHWESQYATSGASTTGRRYQNHHRDGSNVLLFVRQERENEIGRPSPYILLGPVRYSSHEGDRPMAVTWRLRHPLPSDVHHFTAVTTG